MYCNLNTHPSLLMLNFRTEEWYLGLDASYRRSLALYFIFQTV